MKRSEFFKRIMIGAAAVAVAPSVVCATTTIKPDVPQKSRPKYSDVSTVFMTGMNMVVFVASSDSNVRPGNIIRMTESGKKHYNLYVTRAREDKENKTIKVEAITTDGSNITVTQGWRFTVFIDPTKER